MSWRMSVSRYSGSHVLHIRPWSSTPLPPISHKAVGNLILRQRMCCQRFQSSYNHPSQPLSWNWPSSLVIVPYGQRVSELLRETLLPLGGRSPRAPANSSVFPSPKSSRRQESFPPGSVVFSTYIYSSRWRLSQRQERLAHCRRLSSRTPCSARRARTRGES